jgi:hypothetical protein
MKWFLIYQICTGIECGYDVSRLPVREEMMANKRQCELKAARKSALNSIRKANGIDLFSWGYCEGRK